MEAGTADAMAAAHAALLVHGRLQPSIDAATMALLDGHDGEAVVALAAAHPDASRSEAAELVARAHEELGSGLERLTLPDARRIALRALVLEARAGSRSLPEVTAWAHDAIGHSEDAVLEPIVALGDELELRGGRSRADVDGILDRFLAATADDLARWRPA
ncbi:hypothetical protein OVA14_04930 [Agrococcus sp. SL85]|uniref:hypothetical protein n=1 Tax=Agrococcus sp. SL85 TaxID=2995141 RepID=UPI00226C7FF1|nr:hypothetical protein [Agrococcus sp. SL85]WAC67098.1 hypothetical protein OVA14_04930 [Agrococcus sp. SL85]